MLLQYLQTVQGERVVAVDDVCKFAPVTSGEIKNNNSRDKCLCPF